MNKFKVGYKVRIRNKNFRNCGKCYESECWNIPLKEVQHETISMQ